jgi:uncharacterized protein (DUF58 family)
LRAKLEIEMKSVNGNRVNKFVDSLRTREPMRAAEAPRTADAPAPRKERAPSGAVFDPQVLSKLGRLDLIASTVVDGFMSGKHRSTHKGGCTDFADFRPYSHGDDLRLLDWRHFARSDRYLVKQFDDETNLQALIVVDTSGSMGFGLSTVTKWRYTQMASACLGHMLLRQRDSVGLALAAEQVRDFVKPQPRPNHLAKLIELLGASQPTGISDLPKALSTLVGRMKRRGLMILVSDCFGDVAALKRGLEQFRHHGHDVIVVQILAPEELTFPFRRDAFFQDLERNRRLQVNPATLRKAYLKEFQAFMDKLRQATTDCGVDLATISTGDDLGTALSFYLRRRLALKKLQRTTARTS